MRYTHAIILIICTLSLSKKSYAQDNKCNITNFINYYSEENFSFAAKTGSQILLSETLRPHDDERFRLLYKTIRSYLLTSDIQNAYNLTLQLEKQPTDPLFKDYVRLYKAIIGIKLGNQQQSKIIFQNLLKENNSILLHDSIKAKIFHNLAVIYGQEEQQALRLEFLGKSFELQKIILLNNAHFENYNLSVEVYASTLHNKYKQYETAYKVFQEALSEPFNQEINNYNHALYQNYIALLLDMGMEDKAQNYITKLSSFYQYKSQYFINEYADLLMTLSWHYWKQNNYTNSILYATKILSLTVYNQNTYILRSSAMTNLSRIYLDLQQHDKMRYYLLQNIKESKLSDNRALADAYITAAQLLASIYDDETAYAYIDSAEYLYYGELKLPFNRSFENTVALAYYELEQYNQCLYHLENVGKVMQDNSNYNNYFFWDNTYEKALCHNHLKHHKQAYIMLKDIYNDMLLKYPHLNDLSSTIQNSRFAMLYRQINIALANNLTQQYETKSDIKLLEEAMTYIEDAGKGLELLRSKQNYDRDRLVTGELYHDFTLQSTKVAMALYEATKDEKYLHQAFTFLQKGKSFALLQGVNEKRYKLNSGVPLNVINALNESKEQYDRYLQRYNEAIFETKSDSSLIAQLSDKMSARMNEIDSINSLIKSDYPNYKEEDARAPYLSIKEIQKRISPNQVIIDYYQTTSEIFRFTIDKKNYTCDRIKVNESFNNELKFVIKELSTPFIGQHNIEYIHKFTHASYSLYSKLLGGVEYMYKDKELIIVPHSELSYLPFEALLTADYSDQKPRFKEFPWLIKTQTISYSYNVGLLNHHSSTPVRFNKVLAFAPEYYGELLTDSIDLHSGSPLDRVLPPLHGAQKEINSIQQHYHTKVYRGKDANKEHFIESMQDNDVIHLALHSLNDEMEPFNSQIIFASANNKSGSFKASEIYNYSIKSPLTILSSCSTGSGQKQKGEGLLSIARAFTFAGVESQVMTLWPVNDASGADITEAFYTQLSKGLSKNKALRESKLNYLAGSDGIHAHPYYWANYVLSGNTSPIEQKMPKGIFSILLALAMISVIILFYYDHKKSH
jgi:CHAT domain-containing protein